MFLFHVSFWDFKIVLFYFFLTEFLQGKGGAVRKSEAPKANTTKRQKVSSEGEKESKLIQQWEHDLLTYRKQQQQQQQNPAYPGTGGPHQFNPNNYNQLASMPNQQHFQQLQQQEQLKQQQMQQQIQQQQQQQQQSSDNRPAFPTQGLPQVSSPQQLPSPQMLIPPGSFNMSQRGTLPHMGEDPRGPLPQMSEVARGSLLQMSEAPRTPGLPPMGSPAFAMPPAHPPQLTEPIEQPLTNLQR